MPPAWKKTESFLDIGAVDNAFEAYVNGQKVGSAGSMPPAYENGLGPVKRYLVVSNWLRPDADDVIAIRVYDNEGRGGFKESAPTLRVGKAVMQLAGTWEFRPGDNMKWAALPDDPEIAKKSPARFEKVTKAAD